MRLRKAGTTCNLIDVLTNILVKLHVVEIKTMQRDTGGKLRRPCPVLPIRDPIRNAIRDGFHFRVSRLQTHFIMFLEEAFQGSTTIILLTSGNHDITIFTGGLWLDNDIIAVTNMIFDHRTALDNERIRTLLLELLANIKPLVLFRENLNRLTCGNAAHDRNTAGLLGKLDAAALFGLTNDVAFLFEHRKMVIDMTGTCYAHRTANLAIGRWHALFLHITDDEIVDALLNITCLLSCHCAIFLPFCIGCIPVLAMPRQSRTAIQIITNLAPQVKRLLNEFSENIFVFANCVLFGKLVTFSAQRLGIRHRFCYTSLIER